MNRCSGLWTGLAFVFGGLTACREPTQPPSLPLSPHRTWEWGLASTIAFTSTRDDPTNPNPGLAAEIYLLDGARIPGA